MVSTRRNSGGGSFPAANNNNNTAKRSSSSSDDKPASPSPKCQKPDNGGAAASSEKPISISPTESSKDLRTPEPPANLGECAPTDAQIDEPVTADDDKVDSTPPITDGSLPTLVADKPRASFSSCNLIEKQNPILESSGPWCRL